MPLQVNLLILKEKQMSIHQIEVDIIKDPSRPWDTVIEWRYPCSDPTCAESGSICDEDGYCNLCYVRYDTKWCTACGEAYEKGGETRCQVCIDLNGRCYDCEEYPFLCKCS